MCVLPHVVFYLNYETGIVLNSVIVYLISSLCIYPPPLMDRHHKGSVTYTISHTDQTSLRICCILRSGFGGIPEVPVMSSVLSALYSGLPFQHCAFTTPLFIHNQCGQYRGVLGAVSIL